MPLAKTALQTVTALPTASQHDKGPRESLGRQAIMDMSPITIKTSYVYLMTTYSRLTSFAYVTI